MHDKIKFAFDMAAHVPQIKDQLNILKLHFNNAWGDIAIQPQAHKMLLKFRKGF